MNRKTLITSLTAALLLGAAGLASAQQSAAKPPGPATPVADEAAPTANADALAKQLSNPVAALISVPF